jgi:hypothetical protein
VADYTPIALPGQTFTFNAGGAITGGDLVDVSGSNTVVKSATLASRAFIGVAKHDVASGGKVTIVLAHPLHESVADGTVAAGDQLTTTNTANRQVKTLGAAALNVDVTASPTEASIEAFNAAINTAVNQARSIIGIAVSGGADNTLVRWAQR